jgi:O-antigen/teichoic acid export membrane protein
MAHADETIAKDGFKLVGANVVFSAATFIVATIAARHLGPEEYGAWGVLWALIIISAAFFPTIVMTAAREISAFLAKDQDGEAHNFTHQMALWTLGFGFLLTLGLVAANETVARWLSIENPQLVGLVAFFFLASASLAFFRGVMEGLCAFDMLALNVVLEGGLRLVLGVTVLFAGLGLAGLMGGYIAAAVLAGLIGASQLMETRIAFLRYKSGASMPEGVGARTFRFVLPVLVTHVAIVFLTNMDMILVKHSFGAYEAGIFSVCFTAGKLFFFFSEGLSSAMFPKVVAAQAKGASGIGLLRSTVLLYCAGAVVGLAVAAGWAQFWVKLIFGPEYIDAASLLFPYLLFAALTSAAVLLAKYYLAVGRYGFIPIFVLWVAALIAILFSFQITLLGLAWILAAGGAVLAFALALPLVQNMKPEESGT